MPTVDLIIPVFNEEGILRKNITLLLAHLSEARYPFLWSILIVVNGSTDSSAQIARELEGENSGKVRALVLEKGGKGNAIKEGALASSAEAILFMDIDLAVSPGHIGQALAPVFRGEKDMVIASRLLPESKTERSAIRTFISSSYNLLSRIILGHSLSDLQCGFKAGTRGAFQEILPRVRDGGYFFDTELVTLALRAGKRVAEIPVSWLENRYAERRSKVRFFRDSLRFFAGLLKLRLRLMSEDGVHLSFFRKHTLALLLAFAVGALYAAPHIYFGQDPAYQGIYMAESSDEVFYMTGINKHYEQSSVLGNPYIYEYQDIKNPFQYYWVEFVLGKVGGLFDIPTDTYAILLKFFSTTALALVIYTFAFLVSGARISALMVATAVLLGNELARPSIMDILATLSFASPYTEFLLYSRPVNPSISGLFLWGAFIALYSLWRNPRSYLAIGAAGLLIGILAYTYFYFWFFALTLLAVLLLYALLARHGVLVRSVLIAGTLGLFMSLPFVYALAATLLGGGGGTLAQAVPTHRVILEKMILVPLALYGVLYLYAWWQARRGKLSEGLRIFSEKYVFLLLLLVTGLIVSNQQVLTGKELQQHHFHFFTNIPLFLLAASFLVSEIIARFPKVFRGIAAGSVIIFLFWHASGVQASSYRAHYGDYVPYQELAPIFAWLRDEVSPDSVVLADDFVSTRLTVYTQAFAYSTVYDSNYTGVPRARLEHNYLVKLALLGISTGQVREYIYEKKHRDEIGIVLFGGQYYRDLCGSYGCFPDKVLEKLIVGYSDFLKRPLLQNIKKYKVDYVLWDAKNASLAPRSIVGELVIKSGDYSLFKVR